MKRIFIVLSSTSLFLTGCSLDINFPDSEKITDLDVTIDDGQGNIETKKVICPDVDDISSDVEISNQCLQILNTDIEVFEDKQRDKVCTEQYGGPQTARITGTLKGKEIDAKFSRINGCEINRWDSLNITLSTIE